MIIEMFILRKQFLRLILILWVINLEIKLNEYNPWRQKQSYNLLRPIDKSTEWPYGSNSFHIMHLKVFIINQNNIPKFLLKKVWNLFNFKILCLFKKNKREMIIEKEYTCLQVLKIGFRLWSEESVARKAFVLVMSRGVRGKLRIVYMMRRHYSILPSRSLLHNLVSDIWTYDIVSWERERHNKIKKEEWW